jgi:hypothetical protein
MHPWRRLLLGLSARMEYPLLLRWEMSNGATFQMILPNVEDFEDEAFSATLHFPFTYDEIWRIQLEQRVPGLEPSQATRRQFLDVIQQHKDFCLLMDGDEEVVERTRE